jgi:D-amino peptidase
MKVFISVDMEGVAGVATRHQVVPGQPDYETGRHLMTAEVNAAAVGAFDAGATHVLINDSHGPMDNLIGEELDDRVEYMVGAPKPLSMVEQVGTGFDVAFFVGYHAGCASPDGVLGHAFSGMAFSDMRLNGASTTEAELNALIASDAGVPVGLVTGDEAICAVAEKAFPGVVTVMVKKGIGITAARSKHPAASRAAIREAAARAVRGARRLIPMVVPEELVIEVDVRPNGGAEIAALVPGSRRIGVRTVSRTMSNPQEMMQVIAAWGYLIAAQSLV